MNTRKFIVFLILSILCQTFCWSTSEEEMSNDWTQSFQIQKLILTDSSKYQNIVILQNRSLGKILMLDDIVHFSEKDEFIYHEMISHIPLNIHNDPRHVLIIGGGDGLVLREAVKHRNIESISVIEIDAQVVDLCKQHFSNLTQGALEDPRVRLIIDDGQKYLKKTKSKYDVIIVNSTDLSSPHNQFFENPLYQLCFSALKPSGVAVFQTGSPITQRDQVAYTYKEIKHTFKNSMPFFAPAPSILGGIKSFTLSFKDKSITPSLTDLQSKTNRIRGQLQYYSPEIHEAAFIIPNYLKDTYSK